MEAQRREKINTCTVIKLDIDTKKYGRLRMESVIEKLRAMGIKFTKGEVYFQKKSRTWHIYLWVGSIAEIWLPMVQLLLGSDWNRELLNFERVVNGEKDWNVLFQEQEVLSPHRTRELHRMLKL